MQRLFWTKHVPACKWIYTGTFFSEIMLPVHCYIQGLLKIYSAPKYNWLYIGTFLEKSVPAFKRLYKGTCFQSKCTCMSTDCKQGVFFATNVPACIWLYTGTFWDE